MINKVLSLPEYIEILVVDDNSPDGTAGIVEKYLSNDRVHLLKEKKEGLDLHMLQGLNIHFNTILIM
nr:glycosyltransferase [Brachyspira hyodysenteriae]